MGDEYLTRLENVLDVEAPKVSTNIPSFASIKQLTPKTTANELSVREFLALRGCKLHNVIAKRNSQLGKVAPPSQLLFSDLEILASGPSCVTSLDDKTLATKLQKFLDRKRASVPSSLWYALLGEQENRSFWRYQAHQANYPVKLRLETVDSWKALTEFVRRVKSGNGKFLQADFKSVEYHLGQVRHGDGGQLLAEYARLSTTLNFANQLITERLQRPLCLNKQATNKARHFRNVVSRFFIDGVQKHALALNKREAQLMPVYRSLEEFLIAASPPAYQQWRQQREQIVQKGKTALREHAHIIEKLYQQCGLTVGQPVS